MTQRPWFPGQADREIERVAILPRCDDPPTTALALDAAITVARHTEEDGDAGGRP